MMATYRAFISYSHAADGTLAARLQSSLQRFAKPWYRLRAMRLFRDETSLAANPALWPAVEAAMRDSDYLVLLASPQAAGSDWVRRELEFWCKHRGVDTLLIALTGGDLCWDAGAADFDWERTNALPPLLRGRFREEPLFVDLRWATSDEERSVANPRFQNAVAEIGATLHGRAKDELIGDDVREHRRTRLVAWAAGTALAALTTAASFSALNASRQRDVAVAAERVASEQRGIAEASAEEARRQRDVAEAAAAEALARMLAASAERVATDDLLPRGMLLAVESLKRRPSHEGRRALRTLTERLGRPVGYVHLPNEHDLNGVAFAPHGRSVAVAGEHGVVRIIDTGTRAEIRRLSHPGRFARVTGIAFADGGRSLVAVMLASDFWHLAVPGGEELARVSTDARGGIAVDSSGRHVASARGETVTVRSVAGGERVSELEHGNATLRPAFGGGDRYLALTSHRELALWEVEGANRLAQVDHEAPIERVAFDEPGEQVATVGGGHIRTWSIPGGDELVHVEYEGTLGAVTFSPDGELIAVLSDKKIGIWSTFDGQQLESRGDVVAFAFGPGRMRVTASALDRTARIDDGEDAATVELSGDGVAQHMIVSADGHYAAVDSGRRLHILDLVRRTELLGVDFLGHVSSLSFDRSGNLLAVGVSDGTVRVYRLPTLDLVVDRRLPTDHARAYRVGYSPDGALLASTSALAVHLWDPESGHERARIYTEGTPTGLVFTTGGEALLYADDRGVAAHREISSGRGLWRARHETVLTDVELDAGRQRVLAVGVNDPDVLAWDATERREILGLSHDSPGRGQGQEAGIVSLDLSPDGKMVVTGSMDHTARLWDYETQAELRRLQHAGTVSLAEFSSDGRWVITGGWDGTARISDASSGEEIDILHHPTPVRSLALSPDRRTLATVDDEGGLWLWELDHDVLVEAACRQLGRNLTFEEWSRYLGDPLGYAKTCEELPVHPSVLQGAKAYAMRGEVERARSLIARIAALDPAAGLVERAVMDEVIHGLDVAATREAREGKLLVSSRKFHIILTLRPIEGFDVDATVRRLASESWIRKADDRALKWEVEEALSLLDEARGFDASIEIPARSLNLICWQGAVAGLVKRVLDFCDAAVEGAPEAFRAFFRDARGIARALTGDLPGAAEDLRAARAWAVGRGGLGEFVSQREGWIEALDGGRVPGAFRDLVALNSHVAGVRWQLKLPGAIR